MPSLELDENQSQYQIRSYTPGRLQINDKVFTTSVIVTSTRLIPDWAPQTITEVNATSLQVILELRPDVLLLGTGSEINFISPEHYAQLIAQGIGVELMDTRAACRTFNALTAENRNVAAALIIN